MPLGNAPSALYQSSQPKGICHVKINLRSERTALLPRFSAKGQCREMAELFEEGVSNHCF